MGKEYEPNVFNADCPAQRAIELVASKWSLLILLALMYGPKRHAELLRKLPGISQKVLTQTLKRLETGQLVHRTERPGFPRFVEYRLTERGCSLAPTIEGLSTWAERHAFDLV